MKGTLIDLSDNLLKKVSIHYPDRRVSRRNWVKIWKHSFEFDNYSLTELRSALQEMTNFEATFSYDRVRDEYCRTEI